MTQPETADFYPSDANRNLGATGLYIPLVLGQRLDREIPAVSSQLLLNMEGESQDSPWLPGLLTSGNVSAPGTGHPPVASAVCLPLELCGLKM